MRAFNFSKLVFGFAVSLNAVPLFAQSTAPATPIVSSERRGNSTCLERKAILFCGFPNIKYINPDTSCPVRWLGYKVGTYPAVTECIASLSAASVSQVVYAELLTKNQTFWTVGSAPPSAFQNMASAAYGECRAGFMLAAQADLFRDKDGNDKYSIEECFSPSSSNQDQTLDDLRSIRNKFDSSLKSALEAAINTKSSQPERK